MPGNFMPASFLPKLALPMSLNILRIWAYWRRSWFTSCTLVPEPRAMRLRRLPLITSWCRRSCRVMEPMMASTRVSWLSSTLSAAFCMLAKGPMLGSILMTLSIHLGEHHAGEGELLVEVVGGAARVLSGHGVGHEQDLLRVEQFFKRLHLRHHLVVDVQAAGGVHDQEVTSGVDGFFARLFGQTLDRGGVRFFDFAFVKMGLDGLGNDFQLLPRRGAGNVPRNQHGPVSALL